MFSKVSVSQRATVLHRAGGWHSLRNDPPLSLTWDPLGPNSAFICPPPPFVRMCVFAASHIACYTFPGMIFGCFENAQTKSCTVWALL